MDQSNRELVIAIALLVPGGMLALIGLLMGKFYPKQINLFAGYRTKRSMSRIELWHEGNQFSMRLLFRYGIAALLIGLIMLLVSMPDEYKIFVSIVATLAAVLTSLIQTENRLKEMEATLPKK